MMTCLQDWFYIFYLSNRLELCGLGSKACIAGSVSTLYDCFSDCFSPPSYSLHPLASVSCSCLSFGGHRCAPASCAQPPPSCKVIACSWDPLQHPNDAFAVEGCGKVVWEEAGKIAAKNANEQCYGRSS